MSKQLVKGPGLGTSEWREDFVLTQTDANTPFFQLEQLTGIMHLNSIESGLTAHSGGGQSSALQLAALAVHVVSTVAGANDSVKLQPSTGTCQIQIVHNAAASNSLQLFGSGSNTINGAAAATGVAVAAGKSALCVDFGAGTWFAIIA